MHSERGMLLFQVAARPPERRLWAAVAIGFVLLFAYGVYRGRWSDHGMFLFFAGYGLSFLFSRKVAFYENGVHFPRDPSGARERFITWRQVERFHWDGDVLTIVPSTSVLTSGGGGASALAGGTVRVPAERRAVVEDLLSGASAYSRDAGT